ncbi:hypothetical protein A2U01_0033905, partial [Trifolium medium]|nr:hypothetical protein [Trifolium medium]
MVNDRIHGSIPVIANSNESPMILRSKFVSAVSSCRNGGGAIRSFGLPAVTV